MQFNLADLFEAVAAAVPHRLALVGGDRRRSYRELDERAGRVAGGLAAAGIGAGDHVGVYLTNTVEHVEAMLACFKLRAVPVNVNHRYVAGELAHLFADAELAGLVYDRRFRDPVVAVRPGLPGLRVLVEAGGAPDDRPPAGTIAFEALVESGSPPPAFGPRSADDRYVLYTGGTTGLPKGVVWRQEDIFFATLGGGNPGGPPISRPEEIARTVLTNRAQRVAPFLPPGHPGPDAFVTLALGPLMHASGQWSALGTLLGGGTLVLYDAPHMDMDDVLDLVERERVVMLTLVGDASARPLLERLDARPGRDTSSLLLLGSGGAMLSGDVKARLLEALPSVLAITEAIGSSEAPVQGIAVTRRGGAPPESLRFVPKDVTMVVDDDLRPVAPGSGVVGRLATRGHVPLGYFRDAAKSARTFVDIDGARWSLPGDMATVEADGTVRLLGRGALCINTGGEKVYPEEVEAVLKRHPAVADAVVVGLADPQWGERVAAVVEAADPDRPPGLEELQAHARAHLAGYKVPRALAVVAEVRRSPAGKADYPWAAAAAEAAAVTTARAARPGSG